MDDGHDPGRTAQARHSEDNGLALGSWSSPGFQRLTVGKNDHADIDVRYGRMLVRVEHQNDEIYLPSGAVSLARQRQDLRMIIEIISSPTNVQWH